MNLVSFVYLEQSLAHGPDQWITEWVTSTGLLESDPMYFSKYLSIFLFVIYLEKIFCQKCKKKKKSLLLIIYASCFLGIMPYNISVSNYLTCLNDQLRKKFYNRWKDRLAKSIVKKKTTSLNWNHLCRPGFNPWVRKIPWRRKWKPTLIWKTPWSEEPGRLQSMGSKRVGHGWATSLSPFTFHASPRNEMLT